MESITDVLSKGFTTLLNNTVLFVPAAILGIVTLAAGFLYGIGISFAMPLLNLQFSFPAVIGIMLLTVLIYLIFTILMTAYFTAGHIGMAKEVSSTGKTTMAHFWLYAKQYFGRLFITGVIRQLLSAVALIFWIPAIYSIIRFGLNNLESSMGSFEGIMSFLIMFFVLLFIGLTLTLIYELILYVLFFFVGYNIVVDDFSAIESYKKSLSLLREKVSQVLLFIIIIIVILIIFWLIAGGILFAIATVLNLVTMPFMLIPFAGTIISVIVSLIVSILGAIATMIITTITTVWITRFYMAVTEKQLSP